MRLDDTSQKIVDAAMALVRDQGYMATTTKEIAKTAGVNECTLFRKFRSKKEIILQGVSQSEWRANITPELFEKVTWILEDDLKMFMRAYIGHMTPDFVNLSIGLRAPQIYQETAPYIRKVPETFLSALTMYFEKMAERGALPPADFDALALIFFASTFGYAFLRASFQDTLSAVDTERYIENQTALFLAKLVQT